MMRALCVGGPLDGKEKASEEIYWYVALTETVPFHEWTESMKENPIGVPSIRVVTHVYQFERTGPRAGVWKYQGRR